LEWRRVVNRTGYLGRKSLPQILKVHTLALVKNAGTVELYCATSSH